MAARQWARQWARLVRQEAELQGAIDQQRPPESARDRDAGGPLASLQHIRTQLDRQLDVLEALRNATAVGAQPAAPALERRQRQCGAALAQLATACAAQLQELEQLEGQLSAEYDEAANSAHQLLATSQPPSERNSSSSGALLPAAASAPGSSLPAEVTAYDAFLQRHGPTGGWHPDDHAEFECILKACRGSYVHAAQLCTEQLGLLHSPEDVAQHARWHEEMQRLALAKRLAVQRWRLAKQAEQAALLEQGQGEAVAEQQAPGKAGSGAANQQQDQQRAAVAEWKAAREYARVEAARRQAAEEEERRQREAEARQRRKQENRQALEHRRVQKDREAADKRELRSTGEGTSTGCGGATSKSDGADSEEARQRLRDRNQQFLERRAAAVRRRSQQAAEHADRVEQLSRRASQQCAPTAERDPGRLMQATSAAALRQLAALSEERSPRDSGYIRHLPRRATPDWCAGARLQ